MCSGYCIVCGSVWPVDELEWIECSGQEGCDVSFNYTLKTLHDNGGECYWAILIKAAYIWFLWDRDNDGHLETCGESKQKQKKVEDF